MKQSDSKLRSVRLLLWIGGILGGFLLLFAFFMILRMDHTGAVASGTVSSDLDTSTTRASDNGLFRVSYSASTGAVPVNQIHQWTLHIETAGGELVEDATITVDGDMPEHGHGLPTRPRVTKYLGNGDYLVEGVKFQMGGWWLMDFTITANGQTDAVHFSMVLE